MNKYSGLNGSFAAQLQAFADEAKEAVDLTFRDVVIKVGEALIKMSPVGNPELWAANVTAQQQVQASIDAYNSTVASINAGVTSNAANYTKSGNLKQGIKLRKPLTKREQRENFGLGVLKTGRGYVGGRFRGNWQFTIGTPASGEVDAIDPAGAETLSKIIAGVGNLEAGEVAYIVNNLPYAIPLEHGHSHLQAPNGMVRVTVERFQSIVSEVVERRKT